jgi:hypothetical protein
MMLKRKVSGKNVKDVNVAIQDCEEDLLKVCETTFLRLLELHMQPAGVPPDLVVRYA